jgi:RNA polymerase sigma factor (sigma-70 family)
MALSTLNQVWEFAPLAERYIRKNFGLDVHTAADAVQDALLRLFKTGPEHLEFPRHYFFQACIWRALQILRKRRSLEETLRELWDQLPKPGPESEVLVALEDEDKPKFFGRATPKQREVLELLIKGHSQEEVSAILRIPSSTVRMRIHLTRRKLGRLAG